MRIIGLDWGEARIGVAVSDPLGISAQPLEHMENNDKIFMGIKALVEKFEAEEIVVGLPRMMDGSFGIAATKVEKFCATLSKDIDIKITLWDERLTTRMAERSLAGSGISRKKARKTIDSSSASLILQSYMDSIKHD